MNETEDILKNADKKIADGKQIYANKDKRELWKHGGYILWYYTSNFFRNPTESHKRT